VKFSLPSGLASKDIPKGENRIGLFLKRERQAVASVQRGTLEKCDTGYCSAIFQGNESFQFYADDMKRPGSWFVQILQNPVLEERMIEVDRKEDKGIFDFSSIIAEFNYGRQSIVLDETSSTPFNKSKVSRKTSWGNLLRVQATLDSWELLFSLYGATLDTTGFFSDAFISKVNHTEYSLHYTYMPWEYLLVGVGGGSDSFRFDTNNDDESILASKYDAYYASLETRYKLPWNLLRLWDGAFVVDAGDGLLSAKKSLMGSAEDVGVYLRGVEGTHSFLRFDFEHVIPMRSTSPWFDRLRLGLGFQYQRNSGVMSGEAKGPSNLNGTLPTGTVSSGKQVSYKIILGREFVLK
jgi:hypothetical protein